MKKVTEVSVPAKTIEKPAHKKIIEKFYCDVCGEEIKSQERRSKCVLCKRDMHGYNWAKDKQCMSTDDRDGGDYPDHYCIFCHDLKFGKYNQEYYNIQGQTEKLEYALDAKILKESLEHNK